MNHRSITVYLSSSTGVEKKYFDVAFELGAAIAGERWTTVYGGNHVGPMGALADGARSRGGRVVGITPQHFNDHGVADPKCDELLIVDSMRTRKLLLEERGNAFVAMPGGIGTLEELIEILVARHLGFHNKPIILLSVDGFWQPFIDLLRAGLHAQFVRPGTIELMHVVHSVPVCIDVLRGLVDT
jgi:uncharacterized protein (TIGR00730 family)